MDKITNMVDVKSNMIDKNDVSWLDGWSVWDKWNKTGEVPHKITEPTSAPYVGVDVTTTTTTGPYKIGGSAPYTTTPYATGVVGIGISDPDIELDKTTKIRDDYEFANFGALLYAIHGMEARIDEDRREISNLQSEIRYLREQVIDLLDDKAERERKEESERESSKYSQKELDALLGGYNSVTYE